MDRKPAIGAFALMTFLASPSIARAEPNEDHRPRARFAVGGYAGGAGIPSWHGGGGLGFYIRGGVQLSELVGLDLQGSGTTALFLGAARGAFTVDFAVRDWLSLGTGASVNGFYVTGLVGRDHSGGTFGVPARLAFHRARRRADGSRRGLEVMIEADAGLSAFASRPAQNLEPAVALYLGVGWARF